MLQAWMRRVPGVYAGYVSEWPNGMNSWEARLKTKINVQHLMQVSWYNFHKIWRTACLVA